MRCSLHCSQGRRNNRQGRSLRSLVDCPSFLLFPERNAQAAMESTLIGQNNPTRPAPTTRHTGTGPAAQAPVQAPSTCHTAMLQVLYMGVPKGISICVWMFKFLAFLLVKPRMCLPGPAACHLQTHRAPARCRDRGARRGDCASGMRRHGVRKRALSAAGSASQLLDSAPGPDPPT